MAQAMEFGGTSLRRRKAPIYSELLSHALRNRQPYIVRP